MFATKGNEGVEWHNSHLPFNPSMKIRICYILCLKTSPMEQEGSSSKS
jgi:hypothetical protein